MNHIENHTRLHNRYFVQRHGESRANKRGIVLSHPVDGQKSEFSLTELGKKQARDRAVIASADGLLDERVIIYTSNFSRARQTANITRSVLGAGPAHVTNRLRERFFGEWERSDSSSYDKVWHEDAKDHTHKINQVESVEEVLDRVTKFLMSLERRHEGRDILLVSHGDTLQILQTAFERIEPSAHRSLRHLEVAEIRPLVF